MSFPTHNTTISQPPWLESLATTIKFKKRSGLLNWNMILGLNLDRVIRTRDVNTLHEIFASLTYADITLEDVSRFNSESILHLLRLNQLELEYMLNVQNFLLSELDKVETVAMEQMEAVDDLNRKAEQERQEILLLRQENSSLRDALAREASERARAQEDLQHARAEATDLRQRHEQFISLQQKPVALDSSTVAAPPHAAIAPLPASALLFPCTACDSVFVSDAARLKHHRRRHPNVPLPVAESADPTRAAPPNVNAGLSVFPTQPAQHPTPPSPARHAYPHTHTPPHMRTAEVRLQQQHPSPSHAYPYPYPYSHPYQHMYPYPHSYPYPPLSPSHPHTLGYPPSPYPHAPYPHTATSATTDALARGGHAIAPAATGPAETGPFPAPQRPQTHLQARVAAQMQAHAHPHARPHARPDTAVTAPGYGNTPAHAQAHTATHAGSRGLPEDLSHGSHRDSRGEHASEYRYTHDAGALGVEAELDALLDDSDTRSAGAGAGAGAGDMSAVSRLDMLRSALDATVTRTLNTPGKPPMPTYADALTPFPTPGVGAGMHTRMDALIARAMDKVGPRTPSRPHTPAHGALPALPVQPMRWPTEDVDAAEAEAEAEAEASSRSFSHLLSSSLRGDAGDMSARSARGGSPAGSVSSRFGVLQWAPDTRASSDAHALARHTPRRDVLAASPPSTQRAAHGAIDASYDAYDARGGRDGRRASPEVYDTAQDGGSVARSGMFMAGVEEPATGVALSYTGAPQEPRLPSPVPPPRPAHTPSRTPGTTPQTITTATATARTPAAAARNAAPLPSSPGFDSDDDEEYQHLLQQAAASERSLQAQRTPAPPTRPAGVQAAEPAGEARGHELAVAEANAAPPADSVAGVVAAPSHPPRPAPAPAPVPAAPAPAQSVATPYSSAPVMTPHAPLPHATPTPTPTRTVTTAFTVATVDPHAPPPPTTPRPTPASARPVNAHAATPSAPTTAAPASSTAPPPATPSTTPSATRPPLPRRPSAAEPPAQPLVPTTPRTGPPPTPTRAATPQHALPPLVAPRPTPLSTPLPTPLPSPSHAPSQARSSSTARPVPVLPPRSASASASRPPILHTDRSHLAQRPSAAASTTSTPRNSLSLAPQLRPAASVPPSLPSTPRHVPRPAPAATPAPAPAPALPSAFLVTFATHGLTVAPAPGASSGPARFLVALYSGTAALALVGVTEALPGPHCTFSRAVPLPAVPDANPFLQVKLYADDPALHVSASLSQLDAILRARPPVGSAVMKLSHGVDALPSAAALAAATDDWRARGCPPLTPEQWQLMRGRAPVSLDLISPQLVKLGATVVVAVTPQYGPASATPVPLLRAASDGNSNALYAQSVGSARSSADTATSAATAGSQLPARGRAPTREAERDGMRAEAPLSPRTQTTPTPASAPAPSLDTSAAHTRPALGDADAAGDRHPGTRTGAGMAAAAPAQTPAGATHAPSTPAPRPPTPARPTPARTAAPPTPTPASTRPPLPPRSASKPSRPTATHTPAAAAQPAVAPAQSPPRHAAGFTMPPLPGGVGAPPPRVVFLDATPAAKPTPTHAAAAHVPAPASGPTTSAAHALPITHAAGSQGQVPPPAADPAAGVGLGLRVAAAPAPTVDSPSAAAHTHVRPNAAPAPTVTVLRPSTSAPSPTGRRHSSSSAASVADAPKPLSVAVSPSSSSSGKGTHADIHAHGAAPRVELSGKTAKPVPAAALSPTNRGEHYPLNVLSHSYGVAGTTTGTRTLAAERPVPNDHALARGSRADPAPVAVPVAAPATAAVVVGVGVEDAKLRVGADYAVEEAEEAESEVNYDAFIVASPVGSPVHGHRSGEEAAGAQSHVAPAQRAAVNAMPAGAGHGKPLLPRKPANMSELVEHAAMVEMDHYYNDLPLPALPPHAVSSGHSHGHHSQHAHNAAAGDTGTIAPAPASSPAAVEYADDFDDDYNNFDDTGNDDLFGRPLNNEFFSPPSPHATAAAAAPAASFAAQTHPSATAHTPSFGAPVDIRPPHTAPAAGTVGSGDAVDASMSSALDNSGTSDYNISLFQPQPSAHSSVRPSHEEAGYAALGEGAGGPVSAAGGVKALAAMLGGQRGMYTSGSAAPFGINASGTGSASLNISSASPFKGVRTQNYLSSVDPDAEAPLASHGDDVDLSDIEGERAREDAAALHEVGNIQLAGVRRVSVQRRAPTKRASFDWL